MKNTFFTVLLLSFVSLSPAWGQVSSDFGGANGGSARVGYDSRTCDSTIGGAIRYDSATNVLEYCNETGWVFPDNGCVGPSDCAAIGDQCTDNTIFAGCHPVTQAQIFLHPNNQSASSQWSTESVVTSATSDSDGKANHDWIVANKTITLYPAFKLCDDLNIASALGHTDWYLPSRVELYYLWTHQTAINAGPGTAFIATIYWSSTELGSGTAWYQDFSTGIQNSSTKTSSRDVRCLRR